MKCPKVIIYDYSSKVNIHDVDLFISNYSIHYMLGNKQDINTIKEMLKHCTYSMYLYYDANRILTLLKDGEYKNDKYHIKKINNKTISILIPTLSDEMYEESLVY